MNVNTKWNGCCYPLRKEHSCWRRSWKFYSLFSLSHDIVTYTCLQLLCLLLWWPYLDFPPNNSDFKLSAPYNQRHGLEEVRQTALSMKNCKAHKTYWHDVVKIMRKGVQECRGRGNSEFLRQALHCYHGYMGSTTKQKWRPLPFVFWFQNLTMCPKLWPYTRPV